MELEAGTSRYALIPGNVLGDVTHNADSQKVVVRMLSDQHTATWKTYFEEYIVLIALTKIRLLTQDPTCIHVHLHVCICAHYSVLHT